MDSINGTAKEGQDYVKVKEVVEFKENEEEKEVPILIQWTNLYCFYK